MSPNRLDAIREVLLMGPGPSAVYPEVLRALARPTLGHLDPAFIAIMDETKSLLQQVMTTGNALTLPISGTGSAGMEAAFVNLVRPADRVLILINGVFGTRMKDVAGRLGAQVESIDFPWGTPVIVDRVADHLRKSEPYAIVAVVHAETSTGVLNPVEQIGKLVRETHPDSLYLVDGVTSLGGIPVRLDDWQVDAFYSGTQKCLSCPPGLAPLSFSARAVDRLKSRPTKVPNWYLDLSMIISYWEGAKRAYHHTAPINMIYGLYQALRCVLEEGLNVAFARHRAAHERLVVGLAQIGLELLVAPDVRLPQLNAVKVPDGVDEAAVRSRLLTQDAIEIGAGLGPLAGKIWRVGLMGHTARPEHVDRVVAALKGALGR
ncbi:MAG TPA: alanine--glyoxylate aminotransferase family protein [Tepidisphaeraceae bacterium]|nr:alanine--glyoxylate aminotransferase family protein [Tepidisphaeraceae bacterium]